MGHIWVVGNLAYDLTFQVAQLPRPGETVNASKSSKNLGGKGANQAVAARRTGRAVSLWAALGKDADGRRATAILADEGIHTDLLCYLNEPTDLSVVMVDQNGENVIVTRSACSDSYRPNPADLCRFAQADDWLVMQGNIPCSITASFLRQARAQGLHTLLNPAPVWPEQRPDWSDVEVLVLNRQEACILTETEAVEDAANVLCAKGVEQVVITLGADGAIKLNQAGMVRFPGKPVTAVDATGAGDTFCGVLASGLAAKMPFDRTMDWAIAASSVSVTLSGAYPSIPSFNEMQALLAEIYIKD